MKRRGASGLAFFFAVITLSATLAIKLKDQPIFDKALSICGGSLGRGERIVVIEDATLGDNGPNRRYVLKCSLRSSTQVVVVRTDGPDGHWIPIAAPVMVDSGPGWSCVEPPLILRIVFEACHRGIFHI
jgi:hypothetical protein